MNEQNPQGNSEQTRELDAKKIPQVGMLSFMPSLLDREIRVSTADAFGHEHFAKALESLVEADNHKPPYSIGLLGKWGTGKSSIKSLYLEGLKQDRRKDNFGLIRSQKIRVVTFNAWRFGGENIRRALLRHVYKELGGDEEVIMDRLFNQVQKPTQVPKSWKEIWRDIYDKWLLTLLQVLVVATALIVLTVIAAKLLKLDDQWVVTSILGIQSLLVGYLLKYLLDAKRFAISRYATINRVELPTVSAEQFEKLLVDQIVAYKQNHAKCERLVVFVDDLDRLSAEEMVSGLDAIRTFMEIPNEDERLAEIGIVFVISCDEDRVADALANKRKDPSSDLPGGIFTRTDARRYLDRIFQFRLDIPPFPRQDMRSYALEKILDEMQGVAHGVREHGASIEEVVSRMIHVGVQSPRNALQIVNTFAEAWWLAERREREGAGTNKRGALMEGAVTNHPLALAALCALRVDFPDFYSDLQKEPDLIQRFLDVFVHSKPSSEQPEGVRSVLEKYAVTLKDEDDESSARRLKESWRPLRQYLTGVASVPWPKSLQPLLLLSQDPVSRQIGDAGQRIYEAFVSGDVQGVLADLGRDKDERQFEGAQARWLRDLVDQIETETDDYRDNASAVLVALSDRYPAEEAGHLLVPVARRLASSKRLRTRVGTDKVPSILPHIPQSDQRKVAGSFIKDLLLPSGDTTFTLASGETPSLDEAMAMCRAVADFALSVRSEAGLDQGDDQRLIEWLLNRHVGVAGKTFQFGFKDLESWMEAHEAHLLPAMGNRYLEAAADALGDKDAREGVDIKATAKRVDWMLGNLWEAGQESRQTAWRLATRFVGVTPPEANLVSQQFFRVHSDASSAFEASRFIQSMAERVQRFIGKEAMDEADSDATNLLIAATSARPDLDDEAVIAAGDVCVGLSRHENKAQQSADLATSLVRGYPAEAQRVFSVWAARVTTDLPEALVRFAARHFNKFSEDGRVAAVAELTKVIQQSAPPEDQSRRYRIFIGGVPGDAFQSEPLLGHSQTVLATSAQQYANFAYLREILPAMTKIVESGPKPQVGQMLYALAANAASYPDAFALLHEVMQGKWPAIDAALSPYAPATIFNGALAFVQSNPSQPGSRSALLSMESMVRAEIVDTGSEANLVTGAVSVWPYHPSAAAEVLTRSASVATPDVVAGLPASIPSQSSQHTDALREIWRHYAEKLGEEQRMNVIRSLLGRPAEPVNGMPDGYLRLWCDMVEGELPMVFGVLSAEPDLTSDQKLRVWKQVEVRLSTLPQNTAMQSIKYALLRDESTAKAALDVSDQVSARFSSADAKHGLATELLDLLPQALNLDSKNRLAKWIKDTGNTTILKRVSLESHSLEDIQILSREFPTNNYLKKLLE